MTTLTEGAFAKINLTLDVLDRREDGYHDIRSILQTVALRDDIELLLDTGTGWRIECETAGIPLDETNLAWRAARVFFDTFGGEPDDPHHQAHPVRGGPWRRKRRRGGRAARAEPLERLPAFRLCAV